jgi:hypothetical protein
VLSNASFADNFLWSRLALYHHNFFVVTMNHWRWGCLDNLNMRSVIVMPVVWFVVRRSTDDDADKADG